jgi:hypothetical protein
MAIDAKDIKLLWGKAANRCTMPDCRRPLVAPADNMPATVIVGEMAHIIGEKNSSKSPRGISKLPVTERNRYTNLILLCAHHHTVIDKDETNWPVEKLHTLKRDHELWVEERLGEVVDAELQIYQDFIDRVAISLDLERWEWVCDCLFRQIMHVDFPEGIYQLDFELFRAILPGRMPEFEDSLKNLVARSRAYLEHYLSDAENAPGDPRIMNKKRYKDAHDAGWEEKDRLIKEYELWQRNCTMMLFNMVRALNEFADVVRKDLRPTFFIRQGRFCVHDAMGLMSSTFSETWHLPQYYFPEDALAAPLKVNNDEEER